MVDMRKKTGIIAGSIALLMAASDPALTCRGPQWETSTLLTELPEDARNEPVVARVEPIELLRPPWKNDDDWGSTPWVRVRVIEAINGVNEGQTFVVDTRGSSCDQYFPRSEALFQAHLAGKRYYIAGQFEQSGYGDVVFDGAWKRDMRTGEFVRASRH